MPMTFLTNEDKEALERDIANKQPIGNYVKTVNGKNPDADGNVVVTNDGVGVAIDATLLVSGAAADAEVVGAKIGKIDQIHDQIIELVAGGSNYNLLNLADCVENSRLRVDTGFVESIEGSLTTGYIPVEAGKTYVATWLSGSVRSTRWTQLHAFYDAEKIYINGVAGGRTFTAPDTAAYIRACWYASGTAMTIQSLIDTQTMIGEGTDASHEYEEFSSCSPHVRMEALPSDLLVELKTQNATVERIVGGYNPYRDGVVRKIAHRGVASGIPENTIPAFEAAMKKGYHYIETDVQCTSDGIPVLWHDDDLTAVGHVGESVADHTLEDIKAMRFTSYVDTDYSSTEIPTLEEALIFFRSNGINPYIEIKKSTTTDEQITTMYNLARKYRMDYVSTWISAMFDKLAVLVNINPSLPLTYVSGMTGDIATLIANAEYIKRETNIVNISLYKGLLTADGCRAINEAGFNIETWTLAENESLSADVVQYVDAYTIDVMR